MKIHCTAFQWLAQSPCLETSFKFMGSLSCMTEHVYIVKVLEKHRTMERGSLPVPCKERQMPVLVETGSNLQICWKPAL